MITFFTTIKTLQGQHGISQVNALRNWKGAVPDAEILVFGQCDGLPGRSLELGVTPVAEVEVSNKGLPIIGSMFSRASRLARHPICCFLNADILLPSGFLSSVLRVHDLAQKSYLLAGQRNDVDVGRDLDFSPGWEERLRRACAASWREHPPSGSDFFVFPRGQYQPNDFPPLIVGRPGWDLWMIYDARRRGFQTIDLSFSTRVIHQNHEAAYNTAGDPYYLRSNDEARINLANLPAERWHYFTLLACDRIFRNGQLEANRARNDVIHWFKVETQLGRPVSLTDRLQVRWTSLTRAVRRMLPAKNAA